MIQALPVQNQAKGQTRFNRQTQLVANGNTRGSKENGFMCFRQLSFDADGKLMPVEFVNRNGPFGFRCTHQHQGRFIVRLEWVENRPEDAKFFVIDTTAPAGERKDMIDPAARLLVNTVTKDREIDNFLQPGKGVSFLPLALIPEEAYISTVRKKERYTRWTEWLGLAISWKDFYVSRWDMLQTVVQAMPPTFDPDQHIPLKIVRVDAETGIETVMSCETWYSGKAGGSTQLPVHWRKETVTGEVLDPGKPGMEGWRSARYLAMVRTGAMVHDSVWCGLEIRTFDTDPKGLEMALARRERKASGVSAPKPPVLNLLERAPRSLLEVIKGKEVPPSAPAPQPEVVEAVVLVEDAEPILIAGTPAMPVAEEPQVMPEVPSVAPQEVTPDVQPEAEMPKIEPREPEITENAQEPEEVQQTEEPGLRNTALADALAGFDPTAPPSTPPRKKKKGAA